MESRSSRVQTETFRKVQKVREKTKSTEDLLGGGRVGLNHR